MNILVIEDDTTLNKNICEAFRAENWNVESVFDGLLAERMLKNNSFDCVVMDINLPGKTGFDICTAFRFYNKTTPVLMLTAFSELEDKVKGYDCGADDYLTKPFFMRELVLRVQSLVNRSKNNTHNSLKKAITVAGDITINHHEKKVLKQGNEISLTPKEYQILVKLCVNQGDIVSKSDMVEEIWGKSVNVNTNTIEVYISFLRIKLDKAFGTNMIKTKVGYGYYLDTR